MPAIVLQAIYLILLVGLVAGLVWQVRWLRRVGAREPIPVCRGRKRITHFIGVSGETLTRRHFPRGQWVGNVYS